ncbi:unnamed protein product [Durusdinium trenchii]|uniref:Sister chromatid cohesion protein n=2 Tax=Durusdinium trenchii TaxID=1381693 RepID=A0ABP0JS48_9DINO
MSMKGLDRTQTLRLRGQVRLLGEAPSCADPADPRTDLAKARAPVGLLQLPRSRGERLRHMEIIDRVPFDLVGAYHERETEHGRLVGAARGPIGKILRRHRMDSSTALIHSMLKACVEKRWDMMLWETFADAIRRELSHLAPADIGLVLFCCVKADYRRDPTLVPELLNKMAALAVATGIRSRRLLAAGHASSTAAAIAQASLSVGRRHRRRAQKETLVVRGRKACFPEYAFLAAMTAAQHYRVGRECRDDIARITTRALEGCSGMSSYVLCRLVHRASNLANEAGGSSPGKFLQRAAPELRQRLQDSSGEELSSSDLCLIAHAYAHGPMKADILFKDLRKRLMDNDGVSLLKLSAGELSNLANAFSKLSNASQNGSLELFDRLGRQLMQGLRGSTAFTQENQDALDLRNVCVSLNAFAQASLRHEPFFVACEDYLPALLHSRDCDVRQLAMIAHAYVRVGLLQSCLLPLVWERATRLAPTCDMQSVSLMIFAVTKAAVSDASGKGLLSTLTSRLSELLRGRQSRLLPSQTIVVSTYALAKSGYKGLVEKAVWIALAQHARRKLFDVSLSEAANLASAFAEVLKDTPQDCSTLSEEINFFFADLLEVLKHRLPLESIATRPLPQQAASKFIIAFGDAQCYEAAGVAQEIARRFLLPKPQLPLRPMIQAISKLQVHDEDLVQALTMAQKANLVQRRH